MKKPNLYDEWPAFRIADEKLKALEARLTVKQRECEEERARTQRSDVSNDVERVMAGEPVAPVEQSKLSELDREIRALRFAIKKQREIVSREHGLACRALCQRLQPEHARLARQSALALVALGRAASAQVKFRAELESAGVSLSFSEPAGFPGFGDPSSINSPSGRFLRDACVAGVLKVSELPAE